MSANPGSEPVFPTDAEQPSPESVNEFGSANRRYIKVSVAAVEAYETTVSELEAALSVLVAERDEWLDKSNRWMIVATNHEAAEDGRRARFAAMKARAVAAEAELDEANNRAASDFKNCLIMGADKRRAEAEVVALHQELLKATAANGDLLLQGRALRQERDRLQEALRKIAERELVTVKGVTYVAGPELARNVIDTFLARESINGAALAATSEAGDEQ